MIRSYGPPDIGTPGNVGDLYIDSKTEEMYRCVKIIPDIVNKKRQFVTNYVHGPNTQYFWEKEQNIEFVVPDNCKTFNLTSNDLTIHKHIRHIRVPEGIEVIGSGCFSACTYLETIYLPKSLKTIEAGSFAASGSKLKHITIPSGVTYISGGAFSGCPIESLYIEDGLEGLLAGSLSGMSNLKDVRLPDTLINIDSGAFSADTALTKIFIPNSVTTIASGAFSSSAIKEFIIDKPEGSISGAPWGANPECIITWLR